MQHFQVVARARSLVGEHPFEDTSKSYTALKDALRLCAAFRGTYLDFKVPLGLEIYFLLCASRYCLQHFVRKLLMR